MQKRWQLALLAALLFLVTPLYAQDRTFARLVGQNRYSLRQEGQLFTGPGWEKLQHDVQQSQFVLLGEDHGTAQIPAFTAALASINEASRLRGGNRPV